MQNPAPTTNPKREFFKNGFATSSVQPVNKGHQLSYMVNIVKIKILLIYFMTNDYL